MKKFVLVALLLTTESVQGLAFPKPEARVTSNVMQSSRRNLFEIIAAAGTSAVIFGASSPASAADSSTPVGREINSFIDLVYNFKNTALDGGLDATTLNEPSIPFIEFGEKMKNGEVLFVEFIAPDAKVAYATIKKSKTKDAKAGGMGRQKPGKEETVRLRIGQGYPTGGKNSWSSPDYVIRSVSNFGVPYKFTVPELEKYKPAKSVEVARKK